MPLCTVRLPALHALVNAVLVAVAIGFNTSTNSGPTPLGNLQRSYMLSQSWRVRQYEFMISMTSSMPSFPLPCGGSHIGRDVKSLINGR